MIKLQPKLIKRVRTAARLLGRAALACFIAAAVETVGSRTGLYRSLSQGAYAYSQSRLQEALPDRPLGVVMLDLGSLMEKRSDHLPTLSAEDQADLAARWLEFKDLLPQLVAAKPKSIFVDWELGLDSYLVADTEQRFRSRMGEEADSAYREMMATLQEANSSVPIYFASDLATKRIQEGKQAFPGATQARMAVRARVSDSSFGPYKALEPDNPESRPPDLASHGVIVKLGLEDQLSDSSSRTFLLHAFEGDGDERGFWIDFSYLPLLRRQTIAVEPVKLEEKDVKDLLVGKVVVIADVARPSTSDHFTVPSHERKDTGGLIDQPEVSGGLIHACALLTRANRPLFATPEGWPTFVLSFCISLFFGLLSAFIGHRQSRGEESHEGELIRANAELISMAVMSTSLAGLIWLTPWTRVLFLGFPYLVVTRIVDMSLLAHGIRRHLKHQAHKEPSAPAMIELCKIQVVT